MSDKAQDRVDEIKLRIDKIGGHFYHLLNRLDQYRSDLIECKKRLVELERENAELRANAVEVN